MISLFINVSFTLLISVSLNSGNGKEKLQLLPNTDSLFLISEIDFSVTIIDLLISESP